MKLVKKEIMINIIESEFNKLDDKSAFLHYYNLIDCKISSMKTLKRFNKDRLVEIYKIVEKFIYIENTLMKEYQDTAIETIIDCFNEYDEGYFNVNYDCIVDCIEDEEDNVISSVDCEMYNSDDIYINPNFTLYNSDTDEYLF